MCLVLGCSLLALSLMILLWVVFVSCGVLVGLGLMVGYFVVCNFGLDVVWVFLGCLGFGLRWQAGLLGACVWVGWFDLFFGLVLCGCLCFADC